MPTYPFPSVLVTHSLDLVYWEVLQLGPTFIKQAEAWHR